MEGRSSQHFKDMQRNSKYRKTTRDDLKGLKLSRNISTKTRSAEHLQEAGSTALPGVVPGGRSRAAEAPLSVSGAGSWGHRGGRTEGAPRDGLLQALPRDPA